MDRIGLKRKLEISFVPFRPCQEICRVVDDHCVLAGANDRVVFLVEPDVFEMLTATEEEVDLPKGDSAASNGPGISRRGCSKTF